MIVECTICDKPIRDLQIFGDVSFPLCWDHYAEFMAGPEPWYGLAPHHHDLTRTGSMIGSTVMDPLPEPDSEGRIILGDGTEFVADPSAPGYGTYYPNRPAGWR